ncbi:hypothetical protein BDW42DRAFT_200323 [Aspergillus taichungensis]|uniref:Uncharacterized protein n=1 Tax=Aspergillus taichungensis TaxID=482145 RepID=A0A2J5I989_9EURO|nr:hypothetical protein BDW42DRAFT_200323 [Aspergillus taichungensis]
MTTTSEYHVYTAQSRPDLWPDWDNESHPFCSIWPKFFEGDLTDKFYLSKTRNYDELRKFQFFIVRQSPTEPEILVAFAQSIPFFWPELEAIGGRTGLSSHPEVLQSLPDGGYDTILSRGVEQCHARQGLPPLAAPFTDDQARDCTRKCNNRPNALSALSLAVLPEWRSKGLAEMMLGCMKAAARETGLEVLVVPLRPTRKVDFPNVNIADYMFWTKGFGPAQGPVGPILSGDRERVVNGKPCLPFDPWLRKHVSLGGKVVKVARKSMAVEGDMNHFIDLNFIDDVAYTYI